ncbi:uncharacterized protein BDR25DRAFT_358529 [Lindgomyces ingoldianus]|uniref:Uncharacterized protein n=1 Tax=Lindgomyces ingoldianus TaxID=673940 RepID=A0ACB6QMN1_9PLEO|nr:uncharacterized protein BDR25DRAFT_358529 [Lindgomyces ingoldianus]KAF2467406.1 hypothetical protein BDR25DRAFT_358529 [Lindgomyces ingoldianus]
MVRYIVLTTISDNMHCTHQPPHTRDIGALSHHPLKLTVEPSIGVKTSPTSSVALQPRGFLTREANTSNDQPHSPRLLQSRNDPTLNPTSTSFPSSPSDAALGAPSAFKRQCTKYHPAFSETLKWRIGFALFTRRWMDGGIQCSSMSIHRLLGILACADTIAVKNVLHSIAWRVPRNLVLTTNSNAESDAEDRKSTHQCEPHKPSMLPASWTARATSAHLQISNPDYELRIPTNLFNLSSQVFIQPENARVVQRITTEALHIQRHPNTITTNNFPMNVQQRTASATGNQIPGLKLLVNHPGGTNPSIERSTGPLSGVFDIPFIVMGPTSPAGASGIPSGSTFSPSLRLEAAWICYIHLMGLRRAEATAIKKEAHSNWECSRSAMKSATIEWTDRPSPRDQGLADLGLSTTGRREPTRVQSAITSSKQSSIPKPELAREPIDTEKSRRYTLEKTENMSVRLTFLHPYIHVIEVTNSPLHTIQFNPIYIKSNLYPFSPSSLATPAYAPLPPAPASPRVSSSAYLNSTALDHLAVQHPSSQTVLTTVRTATSHPPNPTAKNSHRYSKSNTSFLVSMPLPPPQNKHLKSQSRTTNSICPMQKIGVWEQGGHSELDKGKNNRARKAERLTYRFLSQFEAYHALV